ncbi:MAG: hypothetical protein ABL974_19235 [Prosthecobacter sp.]
MKPIQKQQTIFSSCQPSDGRGLNLDRDNNQTGDLSGNSRMAGTDVLTDKQREKEARLAVLDELAAEAQKLKLGY